MVLEAFLHALSSSICITKKGKVESIIILQTGNQITKTWCITPSEPELRPFYPHVSAHAQISTLTILSLQGLHNPWRAPETQAVECHLRVSVLVLDVGSQNLHVVMHSWVKLTLENHWSTALHLWTFARLSAVLWITEIQNASGTEELNSVCVCVCMYWRLVQTHLATKPDLGWSEAIYIFIPLCDSS